MTSSAGRCSLFARGCALAAALATVLLAAGCNRNESAPAAAPGAGPVPAVPATRDPDVAQPPASGSASGMPPAGFGNDHSSPAYGSSAALPAVQGSAPRP